MAFDAFLYFPKDVDIKGETTDEEMKKNHAFQIEGFSFGATNTSYFASGTSGGGVGKTDFNEFTFDKKSDTASAQLYKACALGTHLKEAVLECRRQGGSVKTPGGRTFFTVRFAPVIVKEITWSGSGEELEESLALAYGAKKIEYRYQDKSGIMKKSGKESQAEWSMILNQPTYPAA